MASSVARGAAKAVKPIFSRDVEEAKRRVRELYRAWYREVPNTGTEPNQNHSDAENTRVKVRQNRTNNKTARTIYTIILYFT